MKKKTSKKALAHDTSRFDPREHTTTFEAKLAVFLAKQCANSGIMVADVKDIVWNENDHNLISRFAFVLAEENKKTSFDDILQTLNDAWNHFPHKRLNGLAPRDMVERMRDDEEFRPDERATFFDLFDDHFPEAVRVQRQRGHDWAWEFPADFHSKMNRLRDTKDDYEKMMTMEDDEELSPSAQMLTTMTLGMSRALVDESPFLFDAVVMFARFAFEANDTKMARQTLENAIFEARKLFPAEFVLGTDRLPWVFQDNRPFLLVLGEYATLIEAIDGPQKAIPHYEELIALNSNDNQGMRSMLATAYIKTNRLDDILALAEKFPDDGMVNLSVGAILALFKLGRQDEARARIKKGKKYLKHVFDEIVKTDHQKPELIPGRVQVGGADEAWLYWQDQGTFWMATPGAREFLREEVGK